MLCSSLGQPVQHPEIINSSQSTFQISENMTQKWYFNKPNYIPPPARPSDVNLNNATTISITNNTHTAASFSNRSQQTESDDKAILPPSSLSPPPLMLSGWGNNMSPDAFNNNSSLSISHNNEVPNNISVNTNNCMLLPISDKKISNSTIDTSASTKERMDHVPTNKKKGKKKKKVKKKGTKTTRAIYVTKNLLLNIHSITT